MEAYFAPAAVHKRETRSLLGLLKVALQRHAEVFTGAARSARAFSRTSSRSSRAPDSGAIWTLRSGHHATVSLERKRKVLHRRTVERASNVGRTSLSLTLIPRLHTEKNKHTHHSETVSETVAWCLCHGSRRTLQRGRPRGVRGVPRGRRPPGRGRRRRVRRARRRRSAQPAQRAPRRPRAQFRDPRVRGVHGARGPRGERPQTQAARRCANASRRENKNKSANERNDAGAPSGESDARSSGVLRKELVRTCALALEITGISAASALAYVACKLVAHVLRVAPHGGRQSPLRARGGPVASISSDAAVGHETRRAALAATRGVLVECAAELVAPEFVLPHLAATLRDRAALCARATPPRGKSATRSTPNSPRASTPAERFLVEKTAGPWTHEGMVHHACVRTRRRDGTTSTRRGSASPQPRRRASPGRVRGGGVRVDAGGGRRRGGGVPARGGARRGARVRATKPSAAAAMTPLAGVTRTADAGRRGRARGVPQRARSSHRRETRARARAYDGENEKERAFARRARRGGSPRGRGTRSSAIGPTAVVGGASSPGTLAVGPKPRGRRDAGLDGGARARRGVWARPLDSPAADAGPTAPAARARAAAGVARVAAALAGARRAARGGGGGPRALGRRARRAHDAGDGATAGAYAAVLGAADALARRRRRRRRGGRDDRGPGRAAARPSGTRTSAPRRCFVALERRRG